MGIKNLLAQGAISGALSFLSELLKLLHSQFVAGTAADDETKKGLATFVIWYPELKQAATRSETSVDDQMIEEVKQFAESVLPETFIAAAKLLYGPEDEVPVESAE
jgi:hypothetical protein